MEYWTSLDVENINNLGYRYEPLIPIDPTADAETKLRMIKQNAENATNYINTTFAWFQPADNASKVVNASGDGAKAARESIMLMNRLCPGKDGNQQLFTEYPPKIDLNLDDPTKFKLPTDLYAPAPPTGTDSKEPESKEPESEKDKKPAVVRSLAIAPKEKATSISTTESKVADKPIVSLPKSQPEKIEVTSSLSSKSVGVGSKDASAQDIKPDPNEYVSLLATLHHIQI
jgi:hypothetical protein